MRAAWMTAAASIVVSLVGCSSSDSAVLRSEFTQVANDIERCEKAATGTALVTSGDIDACKRGLMTMEYNCGGPEVLLVTIEDVTYAMRSDRRPLTLPDEYGDVLGEFCKA